MSCPAALLSSLPLLRVRSANLVGFCAAPSLPSAAPTQLAGGSPPAGAPSTQLVEEAVQPRGSSQNTDAAAAAVAVASDAAAFAAAEASPGPHGGVQLSQRPSPQEAEAAEPSPAELPCVPMDCSPAEPCPPVAQPANGNCAPAMETTGQGPALNLPGGTAPVQLARQPAQQHHEQQAALQPPGARQLQPGQPAQARRRSGPVAAWPARMPRPTDMLIQRSGVFYCASFPPRPGFPAKREFWSVPVCGQRRAPGAPWFLCIMCVVGGGGRGPRALHGSIHAVRLTV